MSTSIDIADLWQISQDISVGNVFYMGYYYLFLWPLSMVYLHGPVLYEWGFWGGADAADICAQLSKASSKFWLNNEDGCAEIVNKRLQSFVVGVNALLYFVFLYFIFKFVFRVLYVAFIRRFGQHWRLTPPFHLDPRKSEKKYI